MTVFCLSPSKHRHLVSNGTSAWHGHSYLRLLLLLATVTSMMPLTLNAALESYYFKKFGKYSQSTKKGHTQELERFRTWITQRTQPNVYVRDITDQHMAEYFDKLRPPRYEPRTFNNYRQYLVQFWAYCLGEGWLVVDPMRHVDPSEVEHKPRLHLTPQEMMQMLDDCPDTTLGHRDRYALAVGMNTALRTQDIAALTIGKMDLMSNILTAYIHKTRKTARLPVTAELRYETFRWFEYYAENKNIASIGQLPNSWSLVPSLRGAGVAVARGGGMETLIKETGGFRHPELVVQRALERLGHPTFKEGFHTLRRSAGQMLNDLLVADGVADPLAIVQALYDHKNRSTTEAYLDITVAGVRRDEMMQGQSIMTRAAEAQREKNAKIDAADIEFNHKVQSTEGYLKETRRRA